MKIIIVHFIKMMQLQIVGATSSILKVSTFVSFALVIYFSLRTIILRKHEIENYL